MNALFLHSRILRHHRHRRRMRADRPLLRFLLPLHHEGPQGQEAPAPGLSDI